MAGLPFHQLDAYLRKLLRAGFRVAVCEQLEDSSKAKGIVQRGVTRVITPGTLVDETLLDSETPATLGAIVFTEAGDDSGAALAVVELATGAFVVTDCPAKGLIDELARRGVRELLYCDTADGKTPARVQRLLTALTISPTARAAWQFRAGEARQALLDQYGVSTLAGFGLEDQEGVTLAAGSLVRYLRETQAGAEAEGAARVSMAHLRPPRRESVASCCAIDAVSLRSLEIERTIRGGQLDGSLLGVFVGGRSSCRTAMGKRTLREWLVRPLAEVGEINARQLVVGALVEERTLAGNVGELLTGVQDVARICGRVSLGRATPRDLQGLARSLAVSRGLAGALSGAPVLAEAAEQIGRDAEELSELGEWVLTVLVEEPPAHLREGGAVRDGVDALLDEARLLQRDAGAWLAEYQKRLIEQYNLPSLKVGFNKIFGYYIELPAAQARSAPAELVRKQTLKNAERYITPELREFEHKVLTAESRAVERERELFAEMCARVLARMDAALAYAGAVSRLDAMLALADKAHARGWVRPEITGGGVINIRGGKHPVLEESLAGDFVPNDAELGVGDSRAALALITGPNMAGKSTFIRQVALIVLLAHAGSYVPAESAEIGVVDRIFTRIGADDALHAGQSTFMVEMIETANILNHATEKSLVVLDEVGRGTSTLDGLSLAWAIVEHLAELGPRTLFATHYHELTDLEERLAGRVRNLHVSVREWPPGDPHAQIIFLHRILPGKTDQSYGLHVARLAGIPAGVISRGREVLASLAVHHGPQMGADKAAAVPAARRHDEAGQMSLFTEYLSHPVVDRLRELKLESLTPMQAFDVLRGLGEMVRSKQQSSKQQSSK